MYELVEPGRPLNLTAFHLKFDSFFRITLSTHSDKKLSNVSPPPIHTIAVLGAGTMGHGIAQVAAAAGYKGVLRDVDDEPLAHGRQSIEQNRAKGFQLGKISEKDRGRHIARIKAATQIADINTA